MLAPGCWQASQDAGGAQCVGWEQGTGSCVPLETSQSPLPKKKKKPQTSGTSHPLRKCVHPVGLAPHQHFAWLQTPEVHLCFSKPSEPGLAAHVAVLPFTLSLSVLDVPDRHFLS